MALIFFGSKTAPIGVFEPVYYKCPNCEELHSTYIVIYSTYFHIYLIPIFPYEKDAVANCSSCGFRRNEGKCGPALIKEFDEKKKSFKHPWWTYIVILIFATMIAFAIFS